MHALFADARAYDTGDGTTHVRITPNALPDGVGPPAAATSGADEVPGQLLRKVAPPKRRTHVVSGHSAIPVTIQLPEEVPTCSDFRHDMDISHPKEHAAPVCSCLQAELWFGFR